MFDHRKNAEITESQIFFTRKCNSRCGACNLYKSGSGIRELDLNKWKQVFLNLNTLGIKTVKLMGGEPTESGDINDLINIINFVKNQTDIRIALLSNSKWNKSKFLHKLCRSGLFAYFASVDTIDDDAIDDHSLEKSQKGYSMLLDLKNNGNIPLLAANIVMSRKNLFQLPKLVTLLSNKGFYINLCPIQSYTMPPTYQGKKISYHFRKSENSFSFTKSDLQNIDRIIGELIQLKHSGIKIAVPSEYLLDIPHFGLYGGTWQCKRFSQLRIDADGDVMLCNEFRFQEPYHFNLASIIKDPKIWCRNFIEYWYEERPKYKCQCYWSCFLQAEKNIEIGSTEFGYYDNPKLHDIGISKNNDYSDLNDCQKNKSLEKELYIL